MSGLLDDVDLRTKMVGQNRLELLLFFLNGGQRYGINVFKVNEVLQRPSLTQMPRSHSHVVGVATMRGKTIPIIDLASAIGQPSLANDAGHVIVTEYNLSMQGFLVRAVDHIVNVNWGQVVAPPDAIGANNYLTAIAQVEKEMIEMIDVEKVLSEVDGISAEVSDEVQHTLDGSLYKDKFVLVVDDSSVARGQVERALGQMGLAAEMCKNGRQAYDLLNKWAREQDPRLARLAMVVSDIEMPEMDGYTLTTQLRANEQLKHLNIVLHTSLSGVFNNQLITKVGADAFVAKFNADEFVKTISEQLQRSQLRKTA